MIAVLRTAAAGERRACRVRSSQNAPIRPKMAIQPDTRAGEPAFARVATIRQKAVAFHRADSAERGTIREALDELLLGLQPREVLEVARAFSYFSQDETAVEIQAAGAWAARRVQRVPLAAAASQRST